MKSKSQTVDWDRMQSDLLKYRKKHFKIRVETARFPIEGGMIDLCITNNGNHWTTISLLKSEIQPVIDELKKHLDPIEQP